MPIAMRYSLKGNLDTTAMNNAHKGSNYPTIHREARIDYSENKKKK